MKTKLLLLFFVVSQISFGQQRTCGMQEHMDKIMFNPVLKKQYEEKQAKFEVEYQKLLNKKASENSLLSPNATIYIPVAVHFPSVSNASDAATKTCFRNLAQSQIDVINADYNAANTDISNWTAASAFYPGVNVGDLDVQFVIATQNHPAGTGIANGTVAVTFGTDFLGGADSDTTWVGYMNFVVRDEGNQILGYSPLGGSPAAGNTVVMNTICFGSGAGCTGYVPQSPYHLGRTVTHELGHFFNLDHTFASNGCNPANANCATEGDRVCDTPRLTFESYGCPAAGSLNACGTLKSLTMNYMDYVNDPCMYMFTAGQATRALAYINTILPEFKPNVLSNTSFLESNFAFYPNPNKGTFNLQFKEVVSDFNVEIFDVTGKMVYINEFYQNSDLVKEIKIQEEISKGIYFMNIKTNDGLITKKIIIE
ncbi:zinc-dependent metalloprotease [Flavobacterium terrigena]|uniref:Por secretion system C-terminal sorting domain-containing protein n=1 Tax=Flavobacterium terrigena TaxID=402734 RepID=A0A1H6SIG2_9FLAO|nr:zinc-dependent metalloprotease [Flavobacterium terrigena]SEI64657.1 Por secretion system C-terminal sorting domain-containing protein [Flavobacterium terrigena]